MAPGSARVSAIKLSWPATQDFWEIPVLFEDGDILAINKPSGLLTSPDRLDAGRPNLLKLLHAGIAEGKPWAQERRLSYLMNTHRLDFETSGILLFAKNKPVLIALANLFGSEKAAKKFVALVQGAPAEDRFEVEASLSPHPSLSGRMHVNARRGKRAGTKFSVLERFRNWTLLQCEPLTDRPHQIRVHLRSVGLPLVADDLYGGRPLLLSRLKPVYRLKPKQTERPLLARVALHAEELSLPHPISGQTLTMTAPWPKDLTVAIKYLRRYTGAPGESEENPPEQAGTP